MMLSIRLLVLLMTTLALAGCANAPGDPPRSRPNVVIVLADDMGYGDDVDVDADDAVDVDEEEEWRDY